MAWNENGRRGVGLNRELRKVKGLCRQILICRVHE